MAGRAIELPPLRLTWKRLQIDGQAIRPLCPSKYHKLGSHWHAARNSFCKPAESWGTIASMGTVSSFVAIQLKEAGTGKVLQFADCLHEFRPEFTGGEWSVDVDARGQYRARLELDCRRQTRIAGTAAAVRERRTVLRNLHPLVLLPGEQLEITEGAAEIYYLMRREEADTLHGYVALGAPLDPVHCVHGLSIRKHRGSLSRPFTAIKHVGRTVRRA